MTVPQTPSPEQLYILLARAERERMDASVIERLKVILHFAEHQYSISETCRQFGISRSTFHRWMERFNPEDLSTLADKSHEPLSFRQSAIDLATVDLIRRYRMRYPQMGKERIAELLTRDHSTPISASSVGRIIDRDCLYFADTPLHWKKRMEHQRTSEVSAASGEFEGQALQDGPTPAPEASTSHITILADDADEEHQLTPRFTWNGIKRFVIVSSVITNIAFVSMLIGLALFERETAIPTPVDGYIGQQQEQTFHAAPSNLFIP